MSEKIIQRSGNIHERKNANKVLGTVGALQGEYKLTKENVRACQERLDLEMNRLKKSENLIVDKKDKLSQIQEVIDSDYLPEGAQPVGRIQSRDGLKLEIQQLEAVIIAQKNVVNEKRELLRGAEKKMFTADKKLNSYVDQVEDAQIALKIQADMDVERSTRLAEAEVSRVKRIERENHEAIEARASQLNELEQLAQSQVQTAKDLHKKVASRVNKATQQTREMVQELKEFEEVQLKDRTEAVLELRTNQNNIRSKAATQSSKYQQKLRNKQNQLENEKQDMLSKGLNPYEEFRKRELSEEVRKQEKKIKESVNLNKAILAERLIREEDIQRKADMNELREKAYEKKHREELGAHIIDERNRKYLREVTTDHVEILDPTGRAHRVDPSKITDIPDASFGLGKSSRIPSTSMTRIVNKIRTQLKVEEDDYGEYQRLTMRSHSAGDGNLPHGLQSQLSISSSLDDNSVMDVTKIHQYQTLANIKNESNLTNHSHIPGAEGLSSTINIPDEKEKNQLITMIKENENNLFSSSATTATTTNLSNSQISGGKKHYPEIKMSPYEEMLFEKAKLKQQKFIEEGTQQIAGGKIFKGQAFISSPSEIIFNDFLINSSYQQKFLLTNTSYTFNSFRLLPLSDQVIDFFEISYTKPGRMSAGVSCQLLISFKPKLNQDINTTIEFYSETGPFSIPLKCFIKRCIPEIVNPRIEFGEVIVGQQMKISLKLKNTGALKTKYVIEAVTNENVEEVRNKKRGKRRKSQQQQQQQQREQQQRRLDGSEGNENEENEEEGEEDGNEEGNDPENGTDENHLTLKYNSINESQFESAKNQLELSSRVQRKIFDPIRKRLLLTPQPISIEKTSGHLDGYSESTVVILCAPLAVGNINQTFQITFHDVDEKLKSINSQGRYVTQINEIITSCCCKELPIYLPQETIDMRCTLYNRIYRKRFEIMNRSSNTYIVNIKIPSPLNKYIEINPTTIYVQGNLSQVVNLKFDPKESLLDDLKYFCVYYSEYKNATSLLIPFEIQVVNQELPIFGILKADVCSSTIELSHTSLSFDDVYVSQQKTLQLTAKNLSLLPQKLAFTNVKKELQIQPNDGFAVLLPNEEIQFNVSFKPSSALHYHLPLTLSTSFNDQYPLKVLGHGVESIFTFQTPVIHLRPTIPGERVVESTVVQNNSKYKQIIEIIVPDIAFSWLKISPTVITLPPHGRVRVEIEYLPPQDILNVEDPINWHQKMVESKTTNSSSSSSSSLGSPFQHWQAEDGWAYATGPFGNLQWKIKNWKSDENQSTVGDVSDENNLPGVGDDEWGIVGNYHLPVFIKPLTMGAITQENILEMSSLLPSPYYLCFETLVSKPEFIAEVTHVDYGQIAVGIRTIKTVKIRNLSLTRSMSLHTSGLNAIGPFCVMNANRVIEPGQWHILVIECQPMTQGLLTELLELYCSDGGTRITLTLRVQGVNPIIDITGLESYTSSLTSSSSSSSSSSCQGGIVNFGNVIATDERIKKFTISNKSLFTVDIRIERAICAGILSSSKQSDVIQRTVSGLPLFTYRPERALIPQGGSIDIEIIFRPDRARVTPFREDFNILVGKGDHPIQISSYGYVRSRQLIVSPANPLDEPFVNEVIQDETDEDIFLSHSSDKIRNMTKQLLTTHCVGITPQSMIKLSFPDPYLSSNYQVGGGSDVADNDDGVSMKIQSKQLLISCLEFSETRPGSSAGTYEFKLSDEATTSKYFTLQNDKGNVPVGGELCLTINCTLPRPKGLGGLEVGSWQVFHSQLILKGGWKPVGEDNDVTVPILLSAYVRL